jgi:hypothetical protein
MALIMLRQRHPGGAIKREEIATAVQDCAQLLAAKLDGPEATTIADEIETRLVVTVGRPTTLSEEEGHIPWYFGKRKETRRFFRRYADFLRQDQQWAPAAIESIDVATDLVMEQLEDPEREGHWDRRGLVVGHVQSGKTANYAGLANKAADAGYKLIIVLAGMHNVLRQQTQRRLDRDVLGYNTLSAGQGFTRIGVGDFDVNIHAEHLTTQAANGDFSRPIADKLGIGVQQRPVLLVIKKNAGILTNLNNWVREILAPRGDTEARPLLVIDDEADQASVDTGEQEFDKDDVPDPDYEPKRINGQIRQLLAAFTRKAYVAYTATPFANILIHDAATADDFGGDLFPRSFIVNLPTPSDYVGASLVFGIGENEDEQGSLDAIRHVDQGVEGWITPSHKKNWIPRYNEQQEIPPSLQEAIMAFALVCAARAARGRPNTHNSMLIHVSRFKDVHQLIFGQVQEWLSNFKRVLRYGNDKEGILQRLKTMWIDDFEPTSAHIRTLNIGHSIPATTWEQVREQLVNATDKIQPQVVNSERKDAIDYDSSVAQGLSIIAIGGDKLSRGLTLEGLSISYFLRAAKMYDTLMQMGRWFGYRPGYVDLCRLYTTPDLELWFRHIAMASEELRERLDHMAMIGSTPETYGLRVQSHATLFVTAPNKMRHAELCQISFQGESKIQTVFFSNDTPNARNATTITGFLDGLGKAKEPDDGAKTPSKATGRRVWSHVDGSQVAALLANLEFPEEARDVNAARLSAYVREQLKVGELTDWTVAVLAGTGGTTVCNGWTFATIARAPLERSRATGRYVVKTILSPRDEALDLTKEELDEALAATRRRRAESKNMKPASVPDGPEIRRVRGKTPQRALLLLYPLSPQVAMLPDVTVPIFGVVVSFPDSNSGRAVSYRFNKVEQRLELV